MKKKDESRLKQIGFEQIITNCWIENSCRSNVFDLQPDEQLEDLESFPVHEIEAKEGTDDKSWPQQAIGAKQLPWFCCWPVLHGADEVEDADDEDEDDDDDDKDEDDEYEEAEEGIWAVGELWFNTAVKVFSKVSSNVAFTLEAELDASFEPEVIVALVESTDDATDESLLSVPDSCAIREALPAVLESIVELQSLGRLAFKNLPINVTVKVKSLCKWSLDTVECANDEERLLWLAWEVVAVVVVDESASIGDRGEPDPALDKSTGVDSGLEMESINRLRNWSANCWLNWSELFVKWRNRKRRQLCNEWSDDLPTLDRIRLLKMWDWCLNDDDFDWMSRCTKRLELDGRVADKNEEEDGGAGRSDGELSADAVDWFIPVRSKVIQTNDCKTKWQQSKWATLECVCVRSGNPTIGWNTDFTISNKDLGTAETSKQDICNDVNETANKRRLAPNFYFGGKCCVQSEQKWVESNKRGPEAPLVAFGER